MAIRWVMGAIVAANVVLAAGCARNEARLASISAKGSDTMVILAQKWAEVYMAQHPGVVIQITGGGTGTGFAALVNRTTDLCNASRAITAAEQFDCVKAFDQKANEYAVCLDGLSVYVHESNPLQELTVAQIRDIFSGRINRWKQLGGPDEPIIRYSRENNSGTYEFFKSFVLKGADFAADAQTMPGTAAVLQAVANDPRSIGYGGAAYGAGAKSLKIKQDEKSPAYLPTEENVVTARYPIWRPLFIYVNPARDRDQVAQYISWIRSEAGQQVVKNLGYFPLPAASRRAQAATAISP